MLAAGSVSAQIYQPDFDPSRHKGRHEGPQNALIILGTLHLSGMGKLDPANLKW